MYHTLRSRPRPWRRQPFTMVELLFVMVILAILAGLIIPKFVGRTEQARQTAAKSELSSFETALDAFEVDNGHYPSGADALRQLIEKPGDATTWRGPYLSKAIGNDPWGNPYIYECPGKHNVNGFDLMSMGADGKVGGGDDICNWDTSK